MNTYSKEELTVLATMLKNAHTQKSNYHHYMMSLSLIANDYDLSKAYRDELREEKRLGFVDITSTWEQEHIHYMEETPYDQLPLYINHPVLCIHTQWRLQIGRQSPHDIYSRRNKSTLGVYGINSARSEVPKNTDLYAYWGAPVR
jgi:hypothetical protein